GHPLAPPASERTEVEGVKIKIRALNEGLHDFLTTFVHHVLKITALRIRVGGRRPSPRALHRTCNRCEAPDPAPRRLTPGLKDDEQRRSRGAQRIPRWLALARHRHQNWPSSVDAQKPGSCRPTTPPRRRRDKEHRSRHGVLLSHKASGCPHWPKPPDRCRHQEGSHQIVPGLLGWYRVHLRSPTDSADPSADGQLAHPRMSDSSRQESVEAPRLSPPRPQGPG